MRRFLPRVRWVLRFLTGAGPALLTDWSTELPPALQRRLLARLGLTDGVHEWMCHSGLCPCESAVDAEAASVTA